MPVMVTRGVVQVYAEAAQNATTVLPRSVLEYRDFFYECKHCCSHEFGWQVYYDEQQQQLKQQNSSTQSSSSSSNLYLFQVPDTRTYDECMYVCMVTK